MTANASRRTFADAGPVSRRIEPALVDQTVRTVATEANALRPVFAAADPDTCGTVMADAFQVLRVRRNADTAIASTPTPVDASP